MTDLREPKSHAILIGAGTYNSSLLDDVPAVRETVNALFAALRGRWGMTGADITTIQDRPREDEVPDVIAARALDTTGVLLVYYVGHGRPDQDGNLYLAMHETNPASARWDRTAVPYPEIARLLRESRAQAIVVILDCCFSGRALPSSGDRGLVMPEGRPDGGFVLTSAAREEHALAGTGERYTTFTGQLLALLENGDPDLDSPEVTLTDAFRYLRRKFAQPDLPTPQRATTGVADAIVLAPNHAHDPATVRRPAIPRPPVPPVPGPDDVALPMVTQIPQAGTDAAPADDVPPAVTSDVTLPGEASADRDPAASLIPEPRRPALGVPGPDGGPPTEDDPPTTLVRPQLHVRERDQGGQGTGGAAPRESPGNAAGFTGASPAPAAPGTAVASPGTSPTLDANLPGAQAPGSAPATGDPQAAFPVWAGPQPPEGQPPGGGGWAPGHGCSVRVWSTSVGVVLVVVALVVALLRSCGSVPTPHSSPSPTITASTRPPGSTPPSSTHGPTRSPSPSTEKCPAGSVTFVGSTAFEPTAQAAKTAYEKQCGQSDVIIG